MSTLAQKRASAAYRKVHEVAENRDEKKRKEYGSLARGMGAMIQVNGLGPSLAFLRAKAKNDSEKAHSVLYAHLSEWLTANVLPGVDHTPADFLQWVVDQNTATYHIATREALEFCTWIKRFAEAEGLVSEDEGANA